MYWSFIKMIVRENIVRQGIVVFGNKLLYEESGGWLVWYHHTGTFSQGKDILKATRASLADETFEMLMFMRDNKHHVAVPLTSACSTCQREKV